MMLLSFLTIHIVVNQRSHQLREDETVNAIIAYNEEASFKPVAQNSNCNEVGVNLVRAIKLLVSKVQEHQATSGSNAAPVYNLSLGPLALYFDLLRSMLFILAT